MIDNYLQSAQVGSVTKFKDGTELLLALAGSDCDLIMLDWKLKKPSGLDIYHSIRKDPKFQSTPILLISGSVTANDIEISKADRSSKFIVKPFTEDVLLSCIAQLRKGSNETTYKPQSTAASPSQAPSKSDDLKEGGMQVLRGSNPNSKDDRGLVLVSGNGKDSSLGLQIDKGNRVSGHGTEVVKTERSNSFSITEERDESSEFTARQERSEGLAFEFKQTSNNKASADGALTGRELQEGGSTQDDFSRPLQPESHNSTSPLVDQDGQSSDQNDHQMPDLPKPSTGMALDDGTVGEPLDNAPILCTVNILGHQTDIRVPLRTIVVDQDEAQLNLTAQYLVELGSKDPLCVKDSNSAWEAISNNPFDLVIMDWKLKGLGGLALYSRIREHDDSYNMPVIVTAGLAHKGDFRLLGESYYTHFLEKPIKRKNFEEAIKETLINAVTHTKITNMISGLLAKVGGDHKKTLQLIEGLLKNISKPLIFVFVAGQHILENGDLELAEKVLRIAHRIDNNNVTVITELSKIYHRTGRSDIAKTMLSRAQIISPDSIERLCLMGEVGLTMQDPVAAKKHFESALRIDKEHVKGNAGLVLAKGLEENKFQLKPIPLSNGKSVTFALASSLNAVAVTYVRNLEITKAINQYQAAMCFIYDAPTLARLQFNLGMAHLREKRLTEALKWFKISSENAAADFFKPRTLVERLEKFLGSFNQKSAPSDTQVNDFISKNRAAAAELTKFGNDFDTIDGLEDVS
jgi:CheY-like chemotaxis protein